MNSTPPTLRSVLMMIDGAADPHDLLEVSAYLSTNGSRFWPVADAKRISDAFRAKQQQFLAPAPAPEGSEVRDA